MRGKYTWDKHRIRACFKGVVQIVQFRAMEVLLGPKPKRKATDMEEEGKGVRSCLEAHGDFT